MTMGSWLSTDERRNGMRLRIAIAAALLAASVLAMAPTPATASTRLVTGLAGGAGSTVGPDGALYVTEPLAGRVSRVDPASGRLTTFTSGLPASIIGLGGVMDVAFIGHTAYVLVTLAAPDVGGSNIDGIYRVDGPHSFTRSRRPERLRRGDGRERCAARLRLRPRRLRREQARLLGTGRRREHERRHLHRRRLDADSVIEGLRKRW
jgi:hypothetical protein